MISNERFRVGECYRDFNLRIHSVSRRFIEKLREKGIEVTDPDEAVQYHKRGTYDLV